MTLMQINLKKFINYWAILVLSIYLLPCTANAQKAKYSHEQLKVEKVPVDKIEHYRNDNDFKYFKEEQAGDGFGALLWFYLIKFLDYIFSNKGAPPYVRLTIYALFIAFVIIMLFRANYSWMFGKNKSLRNTGNMHLSEEIHNIDFDKEINQSLKKADYRPAIRFLYLKFLDMLDKAGFIKWMPGKTNKKYLHEITEPELIELFKKLSRIYEYSWYGHFEPDKKHFEHFYKEFEHSYKYLNKK